MGSSTTDREDDRQGVPEPGVLCGRPWTFELKLTPIEKVTRPSREWSVGAWGERTRARDRAKPLLEAWGVTT